jgi:UDP-glucose 4-epimerase
MTDFSKVVLLTGGMGYIGSHCAVALLRSNYEVILVDNLSNSFESAKEGIQKAFSASDHQHGDGAAVDDLKEKLHFYNVDLAGNEARPLLRAIFQVHDIDAVIHLAAFKSVPESVAEPLRYYKNNLFSLIHLLDVMSEFNVHRLIFSSSATVYAPVKTAFHQQDKCHSALTESANKEPTNPYGRTKWFGESICQDQAHAWLSESSENKNKGVCVVSLRYGNPVNSHPSGALPETPAGPAMNLFNVAMEVLNGKRSELSIFGRDYPTRDGTGVRDYIHVVDLANAHVATLEKIFQTGIAQLASSYEVINVGIGQGFSVLEMVAALEKIHGCKIPTRFQDRRPGDVASVVFDVSKAENLLGWRAERRTVEALCHPSSWSPQ